MEFINTVLYSLIIVSIIIGVCTTIFLFSLMLFHRSIIKIDKVSYLLSANSYIAFIISSPFFLEMSLNSIYGEFHPDISFDGWNCRFKGYVLYITGSVYFFSFLIQSIYRFCRIVYPTRIEFQSLRPYVILSISQWIFAATLQLPSYFLRVIQYLPNDYHCQFDPTDLSGSLLGLSILFLIPFMLTLICYLYTMYYVRVRTTALITINQYRNVRRDLIVLSRLVFLFTFLTAVGLPHVVIPFVYTITGYLPFWVIPFQWLLTVFSLSTACIIQIFVTPPLKKICVRKARVIPIITLNATHTWNRMGKVIPDRQISQEPL